MNVALHGLEEAAGVRYRATGTRAGTAVAGTPILVRYADDVVACCCLAAAGRTGQGAAGRLAGTPGSGLQRGQDAHRHLDEGFDFLGFNLRRYRRGHQPGKLLIKPSQDAVRRIRKQARRRDAQHCVARTRGRSSPGSTRSSGVGPPTTGGWCPASCSPRWTIHVVAHLPVGPPQPPQQAEEVDRLPLLRPVQQVQERPVGVRCP